MPTQIIDGFKLNAMVPIDSRLVTSGTVSRNNLTYKYDGLRVFDTEQKIPFVYIEGEWKEELAQASQASGGGGVIGTGGKNNFISKFSNQGLTNSIIRETQSGPNTLIGINIPTSSPVEAQLHVGGVVKASSFCGNLLGTFVNPGTLPLNRLTAPTSAGDYVLKYQAGQAIWTSLSSAASTSEVQNNTTSQTAYLAFTTGVSGAQTINVSCMSGNCGMIADLSSSQLLMSQVNNASKPPYSFVGAATNGIYGNSTVLGFALNGVCRMTLEGTGLSVLDGSSNTLMAARTTFFHVCKNATFYQNVTGKCNVTVEGKVDTAQFRLSSSCGAGYMMISDAQGNGSWASPANAGVPVGTIIIFLLNYDGATDWTNLPAGWQPCTNFSNSAGTLPGSTHKGQIYMNGKYMDVPDMRDRVLMGSTNMKDFGVYGAASPSGQQTVTLGWSNLPPHKHQVSTSNYGGSPYQSAGVTYPNDQYCGNYKVAATSTSTFTETTNNGTGHSHTYNYTPESGLGYDGGCNRKIDWETSANTGKTIITGSVTTTTTLAGWTDDAGAWIGGSSCLSRPVNIPHEKKQAVMFIIKIDPNATAFTQGHFKIVPTYN